MTNPNDPRSQDKDDLRNAASKGSPPPGQNRGNPSQQPGKSPSPSSDRDMGGQRSGRDYGGPLTPRPGQPGSKPASGTGDRRSDESSERSTDGEEVDSDRLSRGKRDETEDNEDSEREQNGSSGSGSSGSRDRSNDPNRDKFGK